MNDDDIPGFGTSAPTTPLIPNPVDKGKGRATEQLASPTPGLSGNIGSGSGNGAAGSTPNARRQAIGGVRVETRYVSFHVYEVGDMLKIVGYSSGGIDTLDEPITTTLVCRSNSSPQRCTLMVDYCTGPRLDIDIQQAHPSAISPAQRRSARSLKVRETFAYQT